eukprot:6289957-Prymnesium_polylepis.1
MAKNLVELSHGRNAVNERKRARPNICVKNCILVVIMLLPPLLLLRGTTPGSFRRCTARWCDAAPLTP